MASVLLFTRFSPLTKSIVSKIISPKRFIQLSSQNCAKLKMKDEAKLPTKLALAHFDDFYKTVFGTKWHSIRLALLCKRKYCAVINPYVGDTELLENLGAVNIKNFINEKIPHHLPVTTSVVQSEEEGEFEENISELDEDYSRYNAEAFVPISEIKFQEEIINENSYEILKRKLNADKEMELPIKFPVAWQIYAFPKGDTRHFPPPTQDSAGFLSYYLMDAASLLPVWALDLRLKDDVADICASPGGKSLAMAYTTCPASLHLLDISPSRIKKLRSVLDCFLPAQSSLKTIIKVACVDGRSIPSESFDKVLVDAPCTNDRVSVTVEDNNFFQSKRMKERVKLPETQVDLLVSGLKALRSGGSLVYSTCSLSAAQNDGVVHLSLDKVKNESGRNFTIQDLRLTFAQVGDYFSIQSTNYGSLVLPYLPSNFGPMYVCKIKRVV